MTIKKVELRPEGDGSYNEVLYPKTSGDMVECSDGKNIEQKHSELQAEVIAHKADYATDSGVANAYVITLSSAPTSYEVGKIYKFKAINANTGASTFAIGDLTAVAIKKNVSLELGDGDIPAGAIIAVIYDGTNFQLLNVSGELTTHKNTTATTVIPGHVTVDGTTIISTDGVISIGNVTAAGSYVGTGTGGREITIGFAPKWVLIFSTATDAASAYINSGGGRTFVAHTTYAFNLSAKVTGLALTANGFKTSASSPMVGNALNKTYEWMAG